MSHAFWRRAAAALAVAVCAAPLAAAAGEEAPERARVLLVGTYHFDGPNEDYVVAEVDDHLGERRQREIAEVAERLAAFRPTKVALEAVEGVSRLPDRYLAYVNGSHVLGADEREQLGFRVARRFAHPRVYAIDSREDLDFDALLGAARASGNHAFLARFEGAVAGFRALNARARTLSVRAALALHNRPDEVARGHAFYLSMAGVSSGPGRFEGAELLASWLARNYRIAANLERVAESPADRVLVLYGAGHLGALREALAASPRLALVPAADLLGD